MVIQVRIGVVVPLRGVAVDCYEAFCTGVQDYHSVRHSRALGPCDAEVAENTLVAVHVELGPSAAR